MAQLAQARIGVYWLLNKSQWPWKEMVSPAQVLGSPPVSLIFLPVKAPYNTSVREVRPSTPKYSFSTRTVAGKAVRLGVATLSEWEGALGKSQEVENSERARALSAALPLEQPCLM